MNATRFISATLFFFHISIICFSQQSAHFVSASISNNGQLNDITSDFYYDDFSGAHSIQHSHVLNATKFNLHYEYLTSKPISFSLKIGYCKRQDSFSDLTPNYYEINVEQTYFSSLLGSRYLLSSNKFQFSSGLELAYFYVSSYDESSHSSAANSYSYITDGGNAFGINSVTSLKLFLSNKIFLISEMAFGFLSYDLGGNSNYTDLNTGESQITIHRIKLTTVSKPELYLGIGLKL